MSEETKKNFNKLTQKKYMKLSNTYAFPLFGQIDSNKHEGKKLEEKLSAKTTFIDGWHGIMLIKWKCVSAFYSKEKKIKMICYLLVLTFNTHPRSDKYERFIASRTYQTGYSARIRTVIT